MTAEWMHINEAVRTYNKTRQTFYNWIKKWYLHSKKINNKVYISTTDAEQLLSDYIGISPDQESSTQVTSEQHITQPLLDEEMMYELIAEFEQQKHLLTQKMDDQKIGFMHEINLTKQELRTDIQRAAEGIQQQQHISSTQTEKLLTKTQQKVDTLTHRLKINMKRQQFWVGFVVAVLANIVILTILP